MRPADVRVTIRGEPCRSSFSEGYFSPESTLLFAIPGIYVAEFGGRANGEKTQEYSRTSHLGSWSVCLILTYGGLLDNGMNQAAAEFKSEQRAAVETDPPLNVS